MLDGFGARLSRVSGASATFCVLHLLSFHSFNSTTFILLPSSAAVFLTVHLSVCISRGPQDHVELR